MSGTDERLAATLAAFDEANRADPRTEVWQGERWPKELLYGRRMTGWLHRLEPEPSVAVELACRAQHLERWKADRADYPQGRKGYLQWRTDCGRYHARRAGEIMAEQGWDAETIAQVGAILRKEGLKSDPETQLMEDVACLVFLEHEFERFYHDKAEAYDEQKWLRIVRRTWKKMSPRGHEAALALADDLPEEIRGLLERALSA